MTSWHTRSLRRSVLFYGCQLCYCCERKYAPHDNAGAIARDDFAYRIQVDERTVNKGIVEAWGNVCYWTELRSESQQRVWAYRKAAWVIEDLEQDVGLV
jgi:hypothetical protein